MSLCQGRPDTGTLGPGVPAMQGIHSPSLPSPAAKAYGMDSGLGKEDSLQPLVSWCGLGTGPFSEPQTPLLCPLEVLPPPTGHEVGVTRLFSGALRMRI